MYIQRQVFIHAIFAIIPKLKSEVITIYGQNEKKTEKILN
jgi:hypothetical protein